MDRGWGTDFRYVMRVLRRSPGFVVVAVTSLAVGIGGNAAMFGTVRALLLNPMPVERPDELHIVSWRRSGRVDISQVGASDYADPDGGASYRSNFSYPLYEGLSEAAPPGVQLFAFNFLRGVSVVVGDSPATLAGGLMADGAYFGTMRINMAHGRPLTPADDQPDAPLVAVLSHSFWMGAFGGDPSMVGRTVRVNGLATEIVGVTAEGFRGLSKGGFFPQTDITVPLAAQPLIIDRWSSPSGEPLRTAGDTFWLRLMARVSPDVSQDQANQALTARIRGEPGSMNEGDAPPAEVRLLSGAQGAEPVRGSSAQMLYILLGVVGIVLLIACVNLASLMLARGVARQREMAVRRALGGGRVRLIRQMLLESVVLASAGTVCGLALAFLTRGLLGRMVATSAGATSLGRVAIESAIDPMVVGFAAALGIGATLLFGMLPAVRLSDIDPMTWLKHRSTGGATPRLTIGRALLALQIAVSIPLLVGSALFLRTMSNLGSVELGFDPDGMATFQVDPEFARVPEEGHADLYMRVLDGVRQIPGVTSASLVENAPLSGISSNRVIRIDDVRHNVYLNAIGPDYLRTSGMRLIEGRMPGVQDVPGAPIVAVVNERVVRDIFGGRSPVGQVLAVGPTEYEIVGVVNDSRYRNSRTAVPATAFPSALQRIGFGGKHVAIRTSIPIAQLEPALRGAVAQVSNDLPVPGVTSQVARVEESTAQERLFTQLLTMFGAFALLLASIGLHGVVSYSVERRTSEIGVRVAVGARPGQVQCLVLRQVLVFCAVGLLLGLPAALAAGPLVASMLYGVATTDVLTIGAAAIVMIGVALAAGYMPARRASLLDPLLALRSE